MIGEGGLRVVVPGAHARELGERVWDWAQRNLFWLLRHDIATLDWLEAHLGPLAKRSLPHTPPGRLLAVRGGDGDPDAARAAAWLSLSALSLRPGLDALLDGYGARLDPSTPELREAIGEALGAPRAGGDALDARLRDALAGDGGPDALVVVPSAPGQPAPPTRLVCVFQIDEWPLGRPLERLFSVDPRVRNLISWGMPKQDVPGSLFEALPEADLPGARFDEMLAVVGRLVLPLFESPLELLGPAEQGSTYGCHTSAGREAIEGFFREQGFKVLSPAEVLATYRTWARVCHARRARVDPEPWGYPELWDDRFPPRRTAVDRAALRVRAHDEHAFWRRVRLPSRDPFDGFARALEVLGEAGLSRPEVFATLTPLVPVFMTAGSWAFHFAAAIRDEPEVRAALAAAGFGRGHLAHLRRILAGALHGSSLPVPELAMTCAEPVLPADLAEPIAGVLRGGFPVLGARHAIHLGPVTLGAGGLSAEVVLVRADESERVTGLGGRPSVLLTAAQLRAPGAAARLRARLDELARLSPDAFTRLFDDHAEDPFQPLQPFVASAGPALEKHVAACFPVTLADRSRLALRRLELRGRDIFAVASLTRFDAEGNVESVREWEARKLLDARALRAAAAAIAARAAAWRALDADALEAHFEAGDALDPL